jgi:hypothetical protein
MNQATQMDSGTSIYKPSFRKIGSAFRSSWGGGEFTDTQTARWSHKQAYIFSNLS